MKPKVVILRWGHRHRDQRLTSHVALTARALGASGFIMADISDIKVKETIERVLERWGGNFSFEMGTSWKRAIREWKANKGVTVHLTAYGENIQTSDVMKRIRETKKDVMVIVGSQKVPPTFYSESVSDFNVAVGNQPHSECSSLAVFLDRYFEGQELSKDFAENAKMKIVPQVRGKKVVET
ncbi:MAG: tRNA (cytidine(56)-2'-O)-methyltransferase [Candidatus Bathyarchaeum sp.]|nr:MAG: tRNA (cytidine(56)-2'-O)-methyltransferase [Candidatus Bathyarchaeum sp.]